MPRSPKKPCAYPGCARLTDKRYCPEHEKLERDRYNKYERSPDINKKYGRAWKRIRDRYVKEHPLCEMCLKEKPPEFGQHFLQQDQVCRLRQLVRSKGLAQQRCLPEGHLAMQSQV